MTTKRFNIYFGFHTVACGLVSVIVLLFPETMLKAGGLTATPVLGALMISSGINILTIAGLTFAGWMSKERRVRHLTMWALVGWNLLTIYYDFRMGQATGQSMLSGMISHGVWGVWGLALVLAFPEKKAVEAKEAPAAQKLPA